MAERLDCFLVTKDGKVLVSLLAYCEALRREGKVKLVGIGEYKWDEKCEGETRSQEEGTKG